MVRKTRIAGLIVVSASIVFAVLLAACGKQENRDGIVIGCIMPLTGDGAVFGTSIKEGMDLALGEINKAGGVKGKPVTIAYEDSMGDVKTGVAAMRKLIDVDKVPVVMGDAYSSITLACAPVANETHTVLISPISSNYKIADAGDYVFRIWPSDALQGVKIAGLAYQLGYRKAAVIYIQTDYGVGLNMSFGEEFKKLGGKVVFSEPVTLGSTDLRSQVTKAQASSPDVVFAPIHPKEGGLLLKQARQLGLQQPFIMGDGFNEPSGLDVAGNAAEGIIVPSLAKGREQIYRPFSDAYKEAYGKEPSDNAAAGYDLVRLLAVVIAQSGYDAEAIKKGLYNTKGFDGVTGVTSFDSKGEVDKDYAFLQVKGGTFVPYDESK